MLAGGGAVLERDPAIAGLWNRQALATDGTGNVFSIQTIWTFQDDGTVQRRLTTYDMFSEIASEMASTGTWTTARGTMSGSGTVTIQFSAPTAAVLHLPYQFGRDARGEVLLLDGLIYQRSFR